MRLDVRYTPIILTMFLTATISSAADKGYSGYGAESVDQKRLQAYAAKPLPQDLSRKIQSLMDIRSPGMGMLHPNKKQLFFSWRVTGVSQVWRADGPKNFPVQVTGGEDPTSLVSITPDGKWLVLSRDRNGEENPGLYLQDAKSGGALTQIQHAPKVQTIFEFVTKDSQWIYFRANDIKSDSYAIYRYNIDSKNKELIYSGDGYWFVADHLDDGTLLLGKAITNTASEYFVFDSKTKELKPVIGQGEKQEYAVEFAPKRGEFFVLTPKLGDFRRLYLLKNSKLEPITPELNYDVASFSTDRQKKRLIYEVNDAGYSRLQALQAATLKPIKLPQFKNAEQIVPGSWSWDGSHLMLAIITATSPSTSYSYEWSSGKLTQWVLPSTPEVDTSKTPKAELTSYPARDGKSIPMFVYRPDVCKKKDLVAPCPVVVHFHGGPEAQSTPAYSSFVQMFTDEGFVFVEPNVRGSDGYGKTWLDSDNGPLRLQVVTDIEDCSKYLRENWKQNGIAPKLGVMGWSYGGYSTLYAMTRFAGAYDAGVALVGMSNLLTFLNNTAPYRRALRIPEYGDPVKDKDALIQLSPITFIDQIKNPVLIIQGATDPRVPAGEAIQMHEKMQSKKIPSELIIFADEGHGASKRANQVLERGHTLLFFKKHLQ